MLKPPQTSAVLLDGCCRPLEITGWRRRDKRSGAKLVQSHRTWPCAELAEIENGLSRLSLSLIQLIDSIRSSNPLKSACCPDRRAEIVDTLSIIFNIPRIVDRALHPASRSYQSANKNVSPYLSNQVIDLFVNRYETEAISFSDKSLYSVTISPNRYIIVLLSTMQ